MFQKDQASTQAKVILSSIADEIFTIGTGVLEQFEFEKKPISNDDQGIIQA